MVDLKYGLVGIAVIIAFVVILAVFNNPHKVCVVTLYGADGRVIRSWEATRVLTSSTSAKFIFEGEEVSISGTFVIEPKGKEKKNERRNPVEDYPDGSLCDCLRAI